jgi:hypothetical protein
MRKVFDILFGVALVVSLAIAALIFFIDLRAPRGLTVEALYVLPILISLLADSRKLTIWLAVLFTVLVGAGWWFSTEAGVPNWIVASDRIVCVIAIWVTALLGIEITFAKQRIRRMGRLLTICMWTKQVRVNGEWISVEDYLTKHVGLSLSHGISKEAAEQILSEEGLDGR